jgi:hypothetical protein
MWTMSSTHAARALAATLLSLSLSLSLWLVTLLRDNKWIGESPIKSYLRTKP